MHFHYKDGILFCEDVSLVDIAMRHGTPTYVYSASGIKKSCESLKKAFLSHKTSFFYACKANTNHKILELVKSQGFGADIVSGGELSRCEKVGFGGDEIVYSGVGKSDEEIESALRFKIRLINLESIEEARRVNAIAMRLGGRANVSMRINPDISVNSNPKISTGNYFNKFGIPVEDFWRWVQLELMSLSALKLSALTSHIGSQIFEAEPYAELAEKMVAVGAELRKLGHGIDALGLGGGFAVGDSVANTDFSKYAESILPKFSNNPSTELLLEPGRSIVAASGVLLSRVIQNKITSHARFVVLDASMTELIRPALYGARHVLREVVANDSNPDAKEKFQVVGPVCESADEFGEYLFTKIPAAGDLFAFGNGGAYGYCMASQYNSRPLPKQVLVSEGLTELI